MNTNIQIGDWVTSTYYKGIFKVERIHKLPDSQYPVLALKKGFRDDLKPNVGWASCAIIFCQKVSEQTLKEIQSIFESDKKYFKKFSEYKIPPIKVLFNYFIKFTKENTQEELKELMNFIKTGVTIKEVKELLSKLEVEIVKMNQGQSLQLTCFDMEINNNDEYIYREGRLWGTITYE